MKQRFTALLCLSALLLTSCGATETSPADSDATNAKEQKIVSAASSDMTMLDPSDMEKF